jgi:hypothetical protein
MLLTELNYSLLPWLLLCNILEMADMDTPNNRATSANDILISFIVRSIIYERTRRISVATGPLISLRRTTPSLHQPVHDASPEL